MNLKLNQLARKMVGGTADENGVARPKIVHFTYVKDGEKIGISTFQEEVPATAVGIEVGEKADGTLDIIDREFTNRKGEVIKVKALDFIGWKDAEVKSKEEIGVALVAAGFKGTFAF